jgi:membrane protein involved in colicin uptake
MTDEEKAAKEKAEKDAADKAAADKAAKDAADKSDKEKHGRRSEASVLDELARIKSHLGLDAPADEGGDEGGDDFDPFDPHGLGRAIVGVRE